MKNASADLPPDHEYFRQFSFIAPDELPAYRALIARAEAGGREALAQLSAGELPQLILLDLMMPGTDGWKFRAEQIVNPAIASIPVIVITAVASPERIGDLGVAVLTKPLDTRLLLATIKEHCAQGYPEQIPVTSTSPLVTSE